MYRYIYTIQHTDVYVIVKCEKVAVLTIAISADKMDTLFVVFLIDGVNTWWCESSEYTINFALILTNV